MSRRGGTIPNNPNDQEIETTVRSPEHAPVFGGMSGSAKIPAGDSVRLKITGKRIDPM
ncbi:MAG: hypothetical protein HY360_09725 [Verrucomicrobia bacterium]|nr:hypothetical protein [Verrucomicrobiota bacterium]